MGTLVLCTSIVRKRIEVVVLVSADGTMHAHVDPERVDTVIDAVDFVSAVDSAGAEVCDRHEVNWL